MVILYKILLCIIVNALTEGIHIMMFVPYRGAKCIFLILFSSSLSLFRLHITARRYTNILHCIVFQCTICFKYRLVGFVITRLAVRASPTSPRPPGSLLTITARSHTHTRFIWVPKDNNTGEDDTSLGGRKCGVGVGYNAI